MASNVTEYVLAVLSFSVFIAGHALFNGTSVQTVHRGMSVNISCNYKPSTGSDEVVELKTNSTLCSAMKSNTSWIYRPCRNHCRFIWIPETVQMAFEISNLQIKDADTYKCVVTRSIPPPSVLLGEEITLIKVIGKFIMKQKSQRQVIWVNLRIICSICSWFYYNCLTFYIARPVVSVSHVSALGGFPTILCSSEGFYPSALEQLWMRNGEFQNASLTYSNNKTNPDGSFTLHSYLNVSDCINYSCWVNHSSLSQPTILHMSPDCYGNRSITYFLFKVHNSIKYHSVSHGIVLFHNQFCCVILLNNLFL